MDCCDELVRRTAKKGSEVAAHYAYLIIDTKLTAHFAEPPMISQLSSLILWGQGVQTRETSPLRYLELKGVTNHRHGKEEARSSGCGGDTCSSMVLLL